MGRSHHAWTRWDSLTNMKQVYQAANPVDARVVDLRVSEGVAAFTQGQYLSGGAHPAIAAFGAF